MSDVRIDAVLWRTATIIPSSSTMTARIPTLKGALIPVLEGLGFVLVVASPFLALKGYSCWDERLKAETKHRKEMYAIEREKAETELKILAATYTSIQSRNAD
jgi:hypothetical protein